MHNYTAHSIQALGDHGPKALGLGEFRWTPETQVYGHDDRNGSQPIWTQPALGTAREKELILMGAVVHEFHTIMRAKAFKVAYGPSQTSGSELSNNKDHIDWDNGSTFYGVSGGRARSPDKDGVKIPDVMAMGDSPYYKDEAGAAKGRWDENALHEILKGRIDILNRGKPIVL